MKFPNHDEVVKMLATTETILPRETEWKYSNLALAVAGDVVAKVSGEPWDQYVTKHILEPLGMNGSRTHPSPGMAALAVGYGRRVPGKPRRVEPFTDLGGLLACGNMASTVEDLAKFASLQFRDGRAGGAQILKGSTLREMQRIHWLEPDWKSGWGLGWGVSRREEKVRIRHGGAVPGHRTEISLVPAEKFGVIVLTNAEDGRPSLYANQAYAIVASAVARATASSPAAPRTDPSWQKYVGTYTWEDDQIDVMLLDGDLSMIDPSDDNPWESRVQLEPVGANVFRMKGGDQTGELVKFDLDASGNVTRLAIPGSYMTREPAR